MKVWTKVHIKDHNKQVDLIGTALTNYVYGNGPILDIYRKYKVSESDRKELDEYVVNRVSGLLMLYLAQVKILWLESDLPSSQEFAFQRRGCEFNPWSAN